MSATKYTPLDVATVRTQLAYEASIYEQIDALSQTGTTVREWLNNVPADLMDLARDKDGAA